MLLPLLSILALSALPDGPRSPPLLTAEGTRWGDDGKPVVDAPLLGVEVDAAFPDGAAAGFVVMPLSFLRLHVDGLTNGLGAGARLGATLVAFPTFPVRPTLGVNVGYVFGGQGAWALQYIGEPAVRDALSKVNVAFASALAGVELGSPHVAFTLQAGLSWIDLDLGAQAVDFGGGMSLSASGSHLRGFVPSARLGFLFCFG